MRMSVAVGSCVGLALVAAIAVRSSGERPSGPVEYANLDFALKDLNGHDVRLADFKGKPLIINFWATWCAPCQLETPELVDLFAKYQDQGLTIVGISIDDSPDQIRQFAAQYKITYPLLVGLDRDDISVAFGFGEGIPTSVFIKRDGTILGRLQGLATRAWLEKRIQALL